MSTYISPAGEYPRYLGDIQEAEPNWSADQPLPSGWSTVAQIEQPVASSGMYVYEDYPKMIDGSYIQNWVVMAEPSQSSMETLEDKIAKYKAAGLDDETIEVLSRNPSSF